VPSLRVPSTGESTISSINYSGINHSSINYSSINHSSINTRHEIQIATLEHNFLSYAEYRANRMSMHSTRPFNNVVVGVVVGVVVKVVVVVVTEVVEVVPVVVVELTVVLVAVVLVTVVVVTVVVVVVVPVTVVVVVVVPVVLVTVVLVTVVLVPVVLVVVVVVAVVVVVVEVQRPNSYQCSNPSARTTSCLSMHEARSERGRPEETLHVSKRLSCAATQALVLLAKHREWAVAVAGWMAGTQACVQVRPPSAGRAVAVTGWMTLACWFQTFQRTPNKHHR
jgi:hypothetical protein